MTRHAALAYVHGHQRLFNPTTDAHIQLRSEALVSQKFQKESRHHQSGRPLIESPEGANQHPVALPIGLTVGSHHIDRLQ